jgi:hypothetical protein
MMVKGNSLENNEKGDTLEFLDRTMKGSLLTVYFNHLGICGFTPGQANADTIKKVKVEMYCEQITITPVKI